MKIWFVGMWAAGEELSFLKSKTITVKTEIWKVDVAYMWNIIHRSKLLKPIVFCYPQPFDTFWFHTFILIKNASHVHPLARSCLSLYLFLFGITICEKSNWQKFYKSIICKRKQDIRLSPKISSTSGGGTCSWSCYFECFLPISPPIAEWI